MRYISVVFVFILQGCITSLKSNVTLENKFKVKKSESCYFVKQFYITQSHLNTETGSLSDASDYETIDFFRKIEKTINNGYKIKSECKNVFEISISIDARPLQSKNVWQIINFATLAIVPFWNDYKNTLYFKIYKNGKEVATMTSNIEYSYYSSLFLIPAMPFNNTIINDFSDDILDKHIQNIANQLK